MNESYTIELLAGMDGLWGYRIIRTHVIDKETRITDTIHFEQSEYHNKGEALDAAKSWMYFDHNIN